MGANLRPGTATAHRAQILCPHAVVTLRRRHSPVGARRLPHISGVSTDRISSVTHQRETAVTIKTNIPVVLLLGLALCGLSASLAIATDAGTDTPPPEMQPVSVEVASGRIFTGEVDGRTNEQRLWMRSGSDSIVLLRPIQWDRVVAARAAGLELSGKQFRDLLVALQKKLGQPVPPETGTLVIVGNARNGNSENRSPTTSETAPSGRVRSLAIEATIANWDSDVEVDGLLLHVYPLDADGRVVELSGTLQVDLVGRDIGAIERGRPFGRLGRWSKRVRPGDFGSRGAVYRLPFQSVHPEFDTRISPHGAVHTRLAVAGQGVFETTESDVRVRPASAVRDDLQLSTGRRFFQHERTGRGKRPSR
jgi:hypothetical protein